MSFIIGHLGDNEIAYLVQKYLKERNLSTKSIRYGDYYELIEKCEKLNVCIITLQLSQLELTTLQKANSHCFIIYITETHYVVLNNPIYYQLSYPIQEEQLFNILDKTRTYVHQKVAFIDTLNGLMKVQINQITHINTEGRNIVYHFLNGKVIRTKSMRTAFYKEISKTILGDKRFLFLKPNVVINLNYVERIKKGAEIELTTGEIIYLSKNNYDILVNAWIKNEEKEEVIN